MSTIERCGTCGIPAMIGRELNWEGNGVISLANSPRDRMALFRIHHYRQHVQGDGGDRRGAHRAHGHREQAARDEEVHGEELPLRGEERQPARRKRHAGGKLRVRPRLHGDGDQDEEGDEREGPYRGDRLRLRQTVSQREMGYGRGLSLAHPDHPQSLLRPPVGGGHAGNGGGFRGHRHVGRIRGGRCGLPAGDRLAREAPG